MDIKILTKAFPGENNAFDAIGEGAMLDIRQYPPGIYVSERHSHYIVDKKLDAFNMHIVDNNGNVRTLYSAEDISNYTDFELSTDGIPTNRIANVGLDINGKLFVIIPEASGGTSTAVDGLYETYVATTTDTPKLNKQEYANQITQLYRILRTI